MSRRPSDLWGWAARVAAFLVLLGIAGWPWPPVRRAFSAAFCAMAGPLLARVSFAQGAGHARLVPAPATGPRRANEHVTSDAEVELSLDGSPGRPRLGVNLRRDAYLPLLILVSAIAVSPLRLRSKGLCWLAGAPISLAASLAALVALVSWVFTGGLGPPGAVKSRGLDLVVRMLLEPPSNRFVAPLALAGVLIIWRRRYDQRSSARASYPRPPS
jgi:hypothetical protein